RITPDVGESNHPQTKLKENAEEIQIHAEWFHSFHCDEQPDLAGSTRPKNFLVAFANGEPIRQLDLCMQPRDLIERHPQCHFRNVTVLDVNSHAKKGQIARFEFRQELSRQHIRAY